jgi:hypothetical protein
LNYHLGNAIKYIARAGHKDSAEQDLKKAIHYLQNELSHVTAASSRVSSSFSRLEFAFEETDTESFDR